MQRPLNYVKREQILSWGSELLFPSYGWSERKKRIIKTDTDITSARYTTSKLRKRIFQRLTCRRRKSRPRKIDTAAHNVGKDGRWVGWEEQQREQRVREEIGDSKEPQEAGNMCTLTPCPCGLALLPLHTLSQFPAPRKGRERSGPQGFWFGKGVAEQRPS